MPQKRPKRKTPGTGSSRPKRQSTPSHDPGFFGWLWRMFISFLKMYVPDMPEEEEPQKKRKPAKRARKYVATKRT